MIFFPNDADSSEGILKWMVYIQEAAFTAERPLRLRDTTAQLNKLNQTIEVIFEIL